MNHQHRKQDYTFRLRADYRCTGYRDTLPPLRLAGRGFPRIPAGR